MTSSVPADIKRAWRSPILRFSAVPVLLPRGTSDSSVLLLGVNTSRALASDCGLFQFGKGVASSVTLSSNFFDINLACVSPGEDIPR